MKKIAILTWQDRFEKYDDQFANEFENTSVVQYGSDFSYDILRQRAEQIEKMGYEAIVARGYTCNLIKDYVSVPLITVEPNLQDVLDSALKYGIRRQDEITLLLHESNSLLKIEELPHYINELFGCWPEVLSYHDMDDYYRVVDDVLLRKRILFTGHNGIRRARELHERCSPLLVGKDAMRDSINEAARIVEIRKKQAEHSKKMETIMDDKNEGIININNRFGVEWINKYAHNILGIPLNESKDRINIQSRLPSLDWSQVLKRDIRNEVVEVEGGTRVLLNSRVLNNSNDEPEAFVFLRKSSNVVEEEKLIRSELYKKGQYAKFSLEDIKSHSLAIRMCKAQTQQCAKFDSNILIYGESGVGKELFAQCIHNESSRCKEPFYAINCAALPDTLLQSELFGYSEGAFTGAKKGGKPGIFELAHKGTVFLDEVGELSPASQSALLRVLQEKEVRRIGSDTIIPVDVRMIAASHKDISREAAEGRFRQDLFYRLNTVFLVVPPLRERKSDIMLLIESFLRQYEEKYNLKFTGELTEDAEKYLLSYQWPGNVRELQNFVHRIFALGAYEKVLACKDIAALLNNSPEAVIPDVKELAAPSRKRLTVQEAQFAVAEAGGNKTKAAKLLGISRTQLWRLLNEPDRA